MADQLREARRKRIIENSEKRLQRILGVTTSNDGGKESEFLSTVKVNTKKIASC